MLSRLERGQIGEVGTDQFIGENRLSLAVVLAALQKRRERFGANAHQPAGEPNHFEFAGVHPGSYRPDGNRAVVGDVLEGQQAARSTGFRLPFAMRITTLFAGPRRHRAPTVPRREGNHAHVMCPFWPYFAASTMTAFGAGGLVVVSPATRASAATAFR